MGGLWDVALDCLLDLLPLRLRWVRGEVVPTGVVEGTVGFTLGVVVSTIASSLVELISGVDIVEGRFGLLGVCVGFSLHLLAYFLYMG